MIMMPKQRLVTICKGLPASGKSTWAKDKAAKSQGATKRINKDDLRAMLDGGQYSKSNEAYVLKMRDAMIIEAMFEGKNIIVDDTNLHPKHVDRIMEIMDNHNNNVVMLGLGYQYIISFKDFTDVDPMECIRRDNARANGVGHEVIMKMYNQYLKCEDPVVEQEWDDNLPICIICDIDGTLANNNWRNPFDASEADQDGLITSTYDVLYTYHHTRDVTIVLFSGRDGSFREPTERFLGKYAVPYDILCMRETGDTRKDSIVKKEMYEEYIKGKYNVLFVMDDRNQVVDMWRKELGLPCHQVNYGDF